MLKSRVAAISIAVAVLTCAPAFGQFTQGNLVVAVEGCGVHGGTCNTVPNGTGNGSGNSSIGGYGDNQAAPLTLFQYTPSGTSSVSYVNSLQLPQSSAGANSAISGEYGSSSEATLQLSGGGQYLTLMGYGVNANTFNVNPGSFSSPNTNTALGQSGSLTGQTYTAVPRVLALIDANGNVNTTTAIYNIFNANNPRSAYTLNGTTAYISGQGTSGDTTGGVFFTNVGAINNSPIAITGADNGAGGNQDTRTVQIVNNTLYVSVDTKSGSTNRDFIGTLGTPPATSLYNSAAGPTQLSNFATSGAGKESITSGSNSNGNNLNSGQKINLSPANYFFASPSVLYVADSGFPKNDSNGDNNSNGTASIGDGGLQKWTNSKSDGSGSWSLVYTLYQGLNIVNNGGTTGTTGLYGLAGVVSGKNVLLYATNYTISDLDKTFLYGITDSLSNTTPPGTSLAFTQLEAAPQDSNFKGVSFAPSILAGDVEITSEPSGLVVSTSGTGCAPGNYGTPVTLGWAAGSNCILTAVTPESAGTGEQYAFDDWDDGSTSPTRTVTAPSSTATYTANFNTQYLLTTSAGTGGTVSAGGYFNAASSAVVTATPNAGFSFVNFTGSVTSTTNPLSIVMNSPQSVTANFAQAQTITFTTPPPPFANLGSQFTVAATGGASGNPVVFTSAGACTNSGATYTMSNNYPPTAPCTVIANQAGGSNGGNTYAAAPTITQTVLFGQFWTDLSSPPNQPVTAPYGSSFYTVSGTTTSELPPTYSAVGVCSASPTTEQTSGPVPVWSTTLTMTSGTGTCTIQVSVAGNSIWAAEQSFNLEPTTTATKATNTVTLSNVPASAEYGSSFTISASGLGTGAISYSSDGVVCTNLGPTFTMISGTGNCTVSATQAADSNYASGSASSTVNATNANTSIGVATSGTPSTYGQSVTFTATLSSDTGLLKSRKIGRNGVKKLFTGSVTWSANTSCGSTPLSSDYPATSTCTTSSLAAGNDAITVSFAGDANHSSATGTLNGGQQVNPSTTTLNVTSVSPSSEDYGAVTPVMITAVLSWTGGGAAPIAANVTIGGNGPSGYGPTNCGAASGKTITCTASYTPTAADASGSYTELASFSGDTNYSSSSSPQTNNFTINAATSTTSVSSSVNPSAYGQSVTFTATINGENGLLKARGSNKVRKLVSGSVTWSANTGCGTTAVTNGNSGTATCTTSSLPVGSNAVTATYSGDANHSGSTGSLSQQVNGGAGTTIAVTSVSPSSEDYGASIPATITAVLSWTGGGAAPTAANVTIGGNGPSSYGPTSCGAASGNSITCTATYTPTAADISGSYTESAAFSGDANYASSSPQTNDFVINLASSGTAVTSSANPSTYQHSVTFTATINGENDLLKTRGQNKNRKLVSGSVTWSANTGCGTTPVTQGDPATATCATSSLPVGTDAITATYSGDINHNGSTGSLSGGQVVDALSQTITFTTNAPASAAYNSGFTVVAKASSGLPVTFTSAGSCSNSGATYTMTSGTGVCSVIANQAGNSSYSAAPPVTETVSATQLSQTVRFTANAPSVAMYGNSFTVAAIASSGLPVSYSSAGACSNSGSTYTMTNGTGTCSVIASQAGDNDYTAAPPKTDTVTANKAPQGIIVTTPAPSTAPYNASYTIVANTNSGLPITYTSAGSCSNVGAAYTIIAGSGRCTAQLTQAGNSDYLAAITVTEFTTATLATQTVTFTGAPASAPFNTSFIITATSSAPITPTITSTGPCSISGNTVTMTSGAGTCAMTAAWANNGEYKLATAKQSTVATKVAPVITWAAPSPISYGTALSGTQLDATANVSGNMRYTPASGTILAAGTHTLSATFTPTAGTDYTAASASVSLQVNQASTSTTITSSSPTITLSKAGTASTVLDFNVSSYKPTGAVTLTASTNETCTGNVAPGTGNGLCRLTFTTSGTRTITASYPGDANHSPSNSDLQSPAVTVTVNPY